MCPMLHKYNILGVTETFLPLVPRSQALSPPPSSTFRPRRRPTSTLLRQMASASSSSSTPLRSGALIWRPTKIMNVHDLSHDDDFLSHLLVEKLGTGQVPLVVHKMDPTTRFPKTDAEQLMHLVRRVRRRSSGCNGHETNTKAIRFVQLARRCKGYNSAGGQASRRRPPIVRTADCQTSNVVLKTPHKVCLRSVLPQVIHPEADKCFRDVSVWHIIRAIAGLMLYLQACFAIL